ncbi:MAG: bifunctional (p)ppGpp synthetase/guanosine-3',5'-bis(diphosphate) 3'-pyrophosphohydrolase [bacterium]
MPPILDGRAPARIMEIVDRVEEYAPGSSDLLTRAYVYTAKVHRGQSRMTGEPYISHPLEVARILAEMGQDPETVAAGILHDTVEDTSATLTEIRELTGDQTAELVDGVTKLSKLDYGNPKTRQAENYRKMLVAMSHDIRVILIKLADRLHNVRTLDYLPAKRRDRIARETAEIYAPLASRLGIGWLKAALEEEAFRHLHPKDYEEIDEKLREGLADREAYLEELTVLVEEALKKASLEGSVTARFKLHSSVYNKMRTQNLDFHQVYDICGLRIIVQEDKDCYAVLGLLHSLWVPIPGRFKDYIALPKANLYQSLHTTVIGPKGQRAEIQIRTRGMHRAAEEGVAAHWRYKESDDPEDGSFDKFEWMRRIVESLQEETDPASLVDSVKINLFQDEVFVFTPRGDVKSFPRGATPVDFAFAIHTEVGHHCVGAKVNGRIIPLSRRLENGDMVEILTNPHRTPGRDWLKFIVTPRAKQKIRAWIRQEQRQRSIGLGRELLEHEFARFGVEASAYLEPEALKRAIHSFGGQDETDLLAAVGFGRLSARKVAQEVLPEKVVRDQERREKSRFRRLVQRVSRKKQAGIVVKGQDDVLIRFAKCCEPIPGDRIVGFITRGRGVTVHEEGCANICDLMADRERLVEVTWGQRPKDEMHLVALVVEAVDRMGVLAGLSSGIAECRANISRVEAETSHDRAGIRLELQVRDLGHLKEVIKKTREVKGVISVTRTPPRASRHEALKDASGE